MNSYPPELLTQLAPVMFVGGLDPPPTSGKTTDPFLVLSHRLREALANQRKVAVWQPEKKKTFQVVLVDKDVRFPPRRLIPPEHPDYPNAHSPLSPLTPSSPLYPDGLIAPIWIRKHTRLVPSVFVVFMRLFEHAPTSRAPLETAEEDRERDAEERRRDTELCAEIAGRKKVVSERGVKLTVVLLASRRLLDDPSLDGRLTYIRRQSGLDPRAALFVLSPVSHSEIGDFVHSLQEALYEPAIEYYTNHSKRVRRKRNRHSQAASSYPVTQPIGSVPSRPLRPEGWTVRYEYKMACFAEFRGEDEVALNYPTPRTKRWAEAKVLADCINLKICKLYLYNNEHSLALAHHNSHMRKFSDFSRGWGIGEETFEFWSWLARQHRAFAELLEHGTRSTLKIPTHFSTTPSSHAAAVAAVQALESGQRGVLEVEAMRALGLNPSQALQHPGFYYYMSAGCTERRRERFLGVARSEAEGEATTAPPPGFNNEQKVDHLALILELYTRAYDLFKAYTPKDAHGHGRLTLWIAYRIAQTYYESGKFDLAVRFFERIAKTYRREQWDSLLRPLLTTWYSCTQQMGDMELSVRLLFEMLGHGLKTQDDDEDSTQEDLLAVLKSSVPSSTEEPLVIDHSESEPILDSCAVFWRSDVLVGEPVAFQLSVTSRTALSLRSLTFTSLVIHMSGEMPTLFVRNSAVDPSAELLPVQRVDLGHITPQDGDDRDVEGPLRFGVGGTIVFCGTVSCEVPATVKIERLVLTLKEGKWNIQIPLYPANTKHGGAPYPQWLSSFDPPTYIPVRRDQYSSVVVRHRPHKVQVSVTYNAPAYIGEEFPITIDVSNQDDKEMEMVVDALLQPTEFDELGENYIRIGDEKSTSLIKGVPLGTIAPGVSTSVTLYLSSAGAVYDRVIDISVQSHREVPPTGHEPESPQSPKSPTLSRIDRDETIRTLAVPAVQPISVEQHAVYRRSLKAQPGLADLMTYEDGYWDDGDMGEAIITTVMACAAPSGIVVDSIKLVRQDGRHAKIVDSSLDQVMDDFLTEWLAGDEFCDRCRITLATRDDLSEGQDIPAPGSYELTWRRVLPDGGYSMPATTQLSLPPLRPPRDGLVALLDVPPIAKLHKPFNLRLVIRNRQPTRSANVVVHLETDNSDAFVLAGLRNGRLPILLPGAEETVLWKLVPVECGFVRIPRMKVSDRRTDPGTEGELQERIIRIVDVRADERREVQEDGGVEEVPLPTEPVVLVLP
ncbi:Gryzun, putative trafficking through golgi-domain-containing protein [Fomitopsis serialis]|uniref:Gryzun, putative trafficking through golgi-domain-containing protein n=1 Tax=Fomitopsis serialis TaxID=139415 RepID=UPI002007E992|nr:Gryzun, putative trafficking through golgi-domain-containing protein [Neoantrodia serialis]KAH9915858.1 Gryzun, putative trafficking through golgi-domain-containing protein [Neoantrodia serialis]